MALLRGKGVLFAGAIFLGALFGPLFTYVPPVPPAPSPTEQDTGGGGGYLIPDDKVYRITVKVTRAGKVWLDAKESNRFLLVSLERVLVDFKYTKVKTEIIDIAITTPPSININKIWVNIRKNYDSGKIRT